MAASPHASSSPRVAMREAVVSAALGLSRDMSRFIPLLVEFDLSGEWAFDGARTCAHWLAERERATGAGPDDVQVRAITNVRLNGRRGRPLVNPRVDLAHEPRRLGHYRWIMPFTDAGE